MEWSQLAAQLTGHAHLATITTAGTPHVSKVAPAVEGDVIWIATNLSSQKARNIAANGSVALMYEPAAEVYVHATATIVTEIETKRRLWNSGLFPFPLGAFFGSADNNDFVLVRLVPTRATLMVIGESGLRRDTWRA